MKFFGRLRANSAVFRNWRLHGRRSAHLDHILFKFTDGQYVTGLLTPEQTECLRVRQDQAVELEMMSAVPDMPLPEEEAEEEDTDEKSEKLATKKKTPAKKVGDKSGSTDERKSKRLRFEG